MGVVPLETARGELSQVGTPPPIMGAVPLVGGAQAMRGEGGGAERGPVTMILQRAEQGEAEDDA